MLVVADLVDSGKEPTNISYENISIKIDFAKKWNFICFPQKETKLKLYKMRFIVCMYSVDVLTEGAAGKEQQMLIDRSARTCAELAHMSTRGAVATIQIDDHRAALHSLWALLHLQKKRTQNYVTPLYSRI